MILGGFPGVCKKWVRWFLKRQPFNACIITIFLAAIALFSSGCINHVEKPVVQNGVLDLRQWNFEQDGNLSLNGEWNFYWEQMIPPELFSRVRKPDPSGLITVPGQWNGFLAENKPVPGTGYATYHVRVLLPEHPQSLSLKLSDVATTYTLYVDGLQAAASGSPGINKKVSLPGRMPQVADIGIRKDKIDIVVHVSNFHHWQGGIWESLGVGNQKNIHKSRERGLFLDSLILGSFLIMGLYHLGMFFTRVENHSPLYFGLLNILIAIRMIATGEISFLLGIESVGFRFHILVIYISFYLCVPVFCLFVRSLFPNEAPKSVVALAVCMGVFLSLFSLASPLPVLTYAMPAFQAFTLGLSFYGIWLVLQAVIHNRKGALIFLCGFVILVATVANDVLYSRQLINTGQLVPLGLFAFIFTQAMLLYQRFSQAFDTVEKQSHVLTQTNSAYQKELETRIKAQLDLKESEAQYRKLIEDSADGICIVRDGKIYYANSRFLSMACMDKSELGRTSFLSFIHPDDREKILTRYATDVSQDQFPGSFSIKGQDRRGDVYSLELNTSRIEWEQQGAMLTFVRDVTEQTKTRELLFQSEKMLSVGGLAAGMAHEINNPLAGMILNAQLIRERLSRKAPANDKAADESGITMDGLRSYTEKRDIVRSLGHIVTAGQNAAEIITNMLSFSRKSDSLKKAGSLEQIVEKTLALVENDFQLKTQYDFKNIQVNRCYDSGVGKVRCEETKICQVLLNLFRNSAQAMSSVKDKSAPSIIDVRLFQDGDMACLTIKDNGPGIEEKVRKRIFEPFFTTKEANKGTGLGLSISYFIITDDHGGQMDVQSLPGQGIKFIIKLPFAS